MDNWINVSSILTAFTTFSEETINTNTLKKEGCNIIGFFMILYKAKGKLLYKTDWWLTLQTDEEICKYYRTLIQIECKGLRLNPPKHGAHITVVSGKHEIPVNKQFWGKYENREIVFDYEPVIHQDREYFWMTVYCEEFETIRIELGLPGKIPLPTPWHITVGNLK